MGERRRRWLTALVALAACATLGACARPVGDLGRAAPDYLNDVAMPTAGRLRAEAMGEPVSNFNRTDAEQAMADRIWRFMVAQHARDWFYDVAAELQRTRLLPGATSGFRADGYYNWLHATPYRSSAVRYSTLDDDVEADIATVPGAFAAICAVREVDRERGVAAREIASLGPRDRADAAARRAENSADIAMFVRALGYRYASYDYALDHLLLETPYPTARSVDADLGDLQGFVARAERGDFCDGPDRFGRYHGDSGEIPSRLSRPLPPPPDPDLARHAS